MSEAPLPDPAPDADPCDMYARYLAYEAGSEPTPAQQRDNERLAAVYREGDPDLLPAWTHHYFHLLP